MICPRPASTQDADKAGCACLVRVAERHTSVCVCLLMLAHVLAEDSTHAATDQPIKAKDRPFRKDSPFNVLKTLCLPDLRQSALSSPHIGSWLDWFC